MFAFIDNDFVPEQAALIPVSDLAVCRGYGVFDYLKVVNGKPVFITDHLNRLFYSANEMRLTAGYSKKALENIVLTLLEKNEKQNAGIRITVTGGPSADGYSISKPGLIITQHELIWPPANSEKGITLTSFAHRRQLPHIKTIDYLLPIRMQPLLTAENADDFLYHHHGLISESPRANFFIVTENNQVITPSEYILKGVTRGKLLNTREYGITEGVITLEDAYRAREAFVTSTTKGVMPVNSIDGKQIGDGSRMVTGHFQKLLAHMVNGEW